MIIHNFPQNSPEWDAIRVGKITGTRVKDVFKSDNLSLMDEIIAEIQTGYAEPNYTSAAMQYGKDMEPIARAEYEQRTGVKITEVGFIQHSRYEWLGMSPDGLVLSDGLYRHGVEFKCPTTKVHVKYIRQNQVPAEYKHQVLAMFLINQHLETHDFISFDPRFGCKPMFTYTTHREQIEKELIEIETGVLKFWDKTQKYLKEIVF